MPSHFEKRYGQGKFEMVQVEDMGKEGCFDAAIKGMSNMLFGVAPHRQLIGTRLIADLSFERLKR